MLAAGMFAFIGLAAIVIDLGMAMSQGRLDQNAADFAALAAANDSYLGITEMQNAAQDITDDNFGESVPLTGCSADLTQPGPPFQVISDCMSVAPFGDLNADSIRRVGQTWVGVPDQASGPFFGPNSIDTRREAAAAILPREGGPLAPLAVGTANAALACVQLTGSIFNDGCTSPLNLVDSPRCTSGGGFVVNLLDGIDHLVARHDGTDRPDDCVAAGSNTLGALPGGIEGWLETLEARLDAGFLDGGGPADLDEGLNGACGGLGDVTAISNCIGGTLPGATLSERFFYAPVVTGSNVTNFSGLYLGRIGWEAEGDVVPLPAVTLDLELVVEYDAVIQEPDQLQCELIDGPPELLAVIPTWDGDCTGTNGLGEAIYDTNELIDPDLVPIAEGFWLFFWENFLAYDGNDLLQVAGYVLPFTSLPEELRGPGPDVNPYEVDGLTQ